jgi:tRNA/rRNA methyltransferase
MLAQRVRFVLVAPSRAGNVGAAARALRVMGFSRLVVVAPRAADFRTDAEAVAFASRAGDVLAGAVECGSLTEALAGVSLAFAMTGYARVFGPRLLSMREAAGQARAELERGQGEVAFVFGTERNGLTNDDVERCQVCCFIPAATDYGSLNLAQAVQVAAYECRLQLVDAGARNAAPFADEPAATVDAIERLHEHLERALIELGYLDPAQPRRLASRLRRLVNRAQPSAQEVDILRGIAAAIIERKSARAGRKSGGG